MSGWWPLSKNRPHKKFSLSLFLGHWTDGLENDPTFVPNASVPSIGKFHKLKKSNSIRCLKLEELHTVKKIDVNIFYIQYKLPHLIKCLR